MTDTAALFRRLHEGPDLLLLANAWDPGSARLIESLGAPAIATTSAGVAWAHGYPDGDALPVELLAATVAGIARIVRAPLTVDVEGGYSDDPALVGENVARLADAGAVGINIEDGTESPDLLCAKIERVKRDCARTGVDVFVNARTDVFLRGLAGEGKAVAETLDRARRYREAGADGLFVPGLTDPAGIGEVVQGTDLPVNIMARPTLPSPADLKDLGVRRLSAGSSIAEEIWRHTAALAADFIGKDDLREALSYADINAIVAGRR
ncbi:isocitrate lyase/phosphoenolpyruvate mutase family protein [Inquilinus sp. CAU 1745]|uniref:isocitrate lyase/PEP mutase family protein n=1 Tax=Inquilinus sp. CAU 1745 TaxID=3140369 RepID=UPI00325AFAB3